MHAIFIVRRIGNADAETGAARRYHARITHRNGTIEHIIERFQRDATGRPRLARRCPRCACRRGVQCGAAVELIGRVIGTYRRE